MLGKPSNLKIGKISELFWIRIYPLPPRIIENFLISEYFEYRYSEPEYWAHSWTVTVRTLWETSVSENVSTREAIASKNVAQNLVV